jgi:hypothetical protein
MSATITPEGRRALEDKYPTCDTSDPAQVEAWFGSFGFSDHWRKVILASCREIIRASSSLTGNKLSEARIDDLARIHPDYITFLTENLEGRRIREEMLRETMRMT